MEIEGLANTFDVLVGRKARPWLRLRSSRLPLIVWPQPWTAWPRRSGPPALTSSPRCGRV